MHGITARAPAVHLLDADPDLGRHIVEAERVHARRQSVARLVSLETPRWDPAGLSVSASAGWLGLYVVDGLIVRRVAVAERASCELFGFGDVLRPWDQDGDYEPLAVSVEWLVIKPARLAVLDAAFAGRVARWPTIVSELMRRITARARQLSLTAAITHLPRTHTRLLLLFHLLADRWGRVTPEGVLVQLPLTHQVLSMLVGSHRPSVTIGLQKLAREELLIRQAHDRWLLTRKGMDSLGP